MKPSIRTLGEILYSPSQYVIPVFQRNYRWEQKEWEKFWESLVEIQGPDKRGNHFMGFLVFVPGLAQPGQHTRFHLIDGQQRLTTASILLVALRDAARHAGQTDLADEIQQFYLVHPMKHGDHRYRMLPKEQDFESYRALVTNHGRPTGRMAGAASYFQGELATVAADSPDRLREVFNTVCERFEFMCATLETENAYNIFKSLNSTGIPLGPSDLIRNFVFMHIPPDEQDEFDRDLWRPLENHFTRPDGTLDEDAFSRFFRDYLMSFGRYVPPKDTFAFFEARYEATDFSPRDLAGSLKVASVHYDVISGRAVDASEAVTKSLAALNLLESSTTYPLLLALFRKRADGVLDSAHLAHAVDMLTGFILRRFVCGESSRGYGQVFVRSLANDKGDTIKTLEAYLVERGWPGDHQFTSAFVEFPLYQRGYARQILETLEHARGHKEPAELKDAQIEHIMPQTLSETWKQALGSDVERIHADWLHRPGNLTLSGYNLELWNHPFPQKQERYADSNIVLTRELKDYDHWTEAEIRERGEKLADAAAKTWIGSTVVPKSSSVSKSNDMVKAPRVGSVSRTGPTETQQWQLEYWTQFMQHLEEHSTLIKPRKPHGRQWMDFAVGRANFWLTTNVHLSERCVSVLLSMAGKDAKPYFHLLHAQKDAIEAEIGAALEWHEMPDKDASRIKLFSQEEDVADRDDWPRQHAWLLEHLEIFHRCFAARVITLDPADYRPSQP